MIHVVKHTPWRKRLLESTRGQVLDLLRTKERTVNELSAALHLTDNAVRAHLTSLERDGLVSQSGMQQGFRKPHATYVLTAEAEQVFPKAYGPLLDILLTVISKKLTGKELRAGMRDVGKKVADVHRIEVKGKSRKERIKAALRILGELGGAASFHASEGKDFIRGNGCPLAAATSQHPEACLIAESLLTEIIGAPVKECCKHGPNPSCCFEVRRSD
jgi:predicted ArsR family transcriptional regulator